MENFKLTCTPRSGAGKGVARKLRFDGKLPAILYGQKEDPVSLALDEPDLRRILHAQPDSAIVKLTIEGSKGTVDAIVRDIQRHPASGKLLHADLQRINLDEVIRVDIHVELEGNPAGVKEQGGILEHVTRSVSVMSLPAAIPPAIVVDVTDLRIHDSARVKDIAGNYPDVEFLDDPETPLATVIPPVVEKAVVEVAEGAEEEAAPEEAAAEEEQGEAKTGEKNE